MRIDPLRMGPRNPLATATPPVLQSHLTLHRHFLTLPSHRSLPPLLAQAPPPSSWLLSRLSSHSETCWAAAAPVHAASRSPFPPSQRAFDTAPHHRLRLHQATSASPPTPSATARNIPSATTTISFRSLLAAGITVRRGIPLPTSAASALCRELHTPSRRLLLHPKRGPTRSYPHHPRDRPRGHRWQHSGYRFREYQGWESGPSPSRLSLLFRPLLFAGAVVFGSFAAAAVVYAERRRKDHWTVRLGMVPQQNGRYRTYDLWGWHLSTGQVRVWWCIACESTHVSCSMSEQSTPL